MGFGYPERSPHMPRILLIKFGAIGDAMMLLPAAHLLHQRGFQIDWVCGPAILPILQLFPWIHPIPADDRAILTGSAPSRLRAVLALWRTLRAAARGTRYTLAATLYYDSRYRLLALPIRADRRLQLSATDRAHRILPGRRHTDEFARILLGSLSENTADGVNPTQLAPIRPVTLPPSPLPALAPGRIRILLAPAGARNLLAEAILRRWPAAHYVALTRLLLDRIPNLEIILIGGPDDTWVQPLFTGLPVTDLIGQFTLPQTIAALDSAPLFVTHDTGPLHLAGLTRTSIVALFGPTDPHVFLPQRPGVVALWGGEGFACRPCYDGHHFAPCPSNDCMAQITPAMVATEVLAQLAARNSGTLPAPRILTPPSTIPPAPLIQLP